MERRKKGMRKSGKKARYPERKEWRENKMTRRERKEKERVRNVEKREEGMSKGEEERGREKTGARKGGKIT